MNAATITPFPRRGSITLLVLEPDAVARCRVCDALRANGFKVLEASTTDEARAVLANLRVELVFADVRVPDGLAFVQWLQAEHPATGTLLTAREPDLDPIHVPEGTAAFISKPYAVEDVVALVSRSIQGRKSGDA